MLKIQYLDAVSNKTGVAKPYKYVSISHDDVELTRLFIKPTEKQYYQNLVGDYDKKIVK